MTEYQININFKEAMRKADRLEEIADNIKNMADSDLEREMNAIRANWKGENAENYLRKTDTVRGKMRKTADNLKKIARTIRTIATNTYNAEMRALEIARVQAGGS